MIIESLTAVDAGHPAAKAFGDLHETYAFFQEHSDEREACAALVARAVLDEVHADPLRLLDMGCGDGGFTARVLEHLNRAADSIHLSLTEPDRVYAAKAKHRLCHFSTHDIASHDPKASHTHDAVIANHSLYYVPNVGNFLLRVAHQLAPGG